MKKNFSVIVLTILAGIALQGVICFFSWCNDLYKENRDLKMMNKELKEENKRLNCTIDEFDEEYSKEFKVENSISYAPLKK